LGITSGTSCAQNGTPKSLAFLPLHQTLELNHSRKHRRHRCPQTAVMRTGRAVHHCDAEKLLTEARLGHVHFHAGRTRKSPLNANCISQTRKLLSTKYRLAYLPFLRPVNNRVRTLPHVYWKKVFSCRSTLPFTPPQGKHSPFCTRVYGSAVLSSGIQRI
jgi:hypothetical protein